MKPMRQGQQNRRGRGRGRKPQNPLTRNFESNGPDVKIRGTAAHIAEKYIALARDAISSGDKIMAENYLQHAEHYNRIIAAAQAQLQGAPEAVNGAGGAANAQPRQPRQRRSDSEAEETLAAAPAAISAEEPIDKDVSEAETGNETDQPELKTTEDANRSDTAEQPARARRRRTRTTNGRSRLSRASDKETRKQPRPQANGQEQGEASADGEASGDNVLA